MTTVPPPTAPPAPPAPAPISAPIATVSTPPPPLLAIPPGVRLEAIVQSSEAALNKVMVQTALGILDLRTSVPLPAEARLVLQVALQAPTVQLLILSVNGQPPAGAHRPGAHVPTGAGAPLSGQSPATPLASPIADRIQVGTVIDATLLRATPRASLRAPAAQSSTLASTPPPTLAERAATFGAALGGKFSALPNRVSSALSWLISPRSGASGKVGGAAPTPAALQSSRSLAEGGAAPAGRSGAASGLAEPRSVLPPGTTIAMRVSAVRADTPAPSGASGTALAAPPAGPGLSATVVSSAPGHSVVETEAGIMHLATPEALPKGLRLTLEPVGLPHPPSAMTDDRVSPLLTRGWPALEDAVSLLKHDAPAEHRILIGTLLAKPDTTLAAGIIAFLTALKAGEIVAWLGEDVVRALNRSRPELMRRLKDDFRELARFADDPGAGDWRIAMVPLNAQTAVEQVRILTRRGSREDPDGAPGESTRFVVDVTLSRLGRVQIDGLVRRKEKRLDLVVRTAEPLPAVMREDIRRLFTQAADATGIAGMLAFDARANGFVEVQTERLFSGGGAIVA